MVIIQENREYSFIIAALRIEVLNACSQYSKYQSVCIITISSRRDPNASRSSAQFLTDNFKGLLSLFLSLPISFLYKGRKNQTKDLRTKAGGGQSKSHSSAPDPCHAQRSNFSQGLWKSSDFFRSCFYDKVFRFLVCPFPPYVNAVLCFW